MASRKSFAEDLAELFDTTPAKELDPVDDALAAGPVVEDSDEELRASDLRSAKRGKSTENGLRMRGDILLEGREYAGRTTTRAAAFGGDVRDKAGQSGSDAEDSGTEDELADGAEEPEDLAVSHAEHAETTNGARPAGPAGPPTSEQNEGDAGGAAGSELEQESGGQPDVNGGPEREAAALEQEYAALQAEDEAALAGMRERARRERSKGAAVARQKRVWEGVLEARILLQRCLQVVNRMPQPEAQHLAQGSSNDLRQAYSAVSEQSAELVDDLVDVPEAICQPNPAIAAAAGTKREREPVVAADESDLVACKWRKIDDSYVRLQPFRDSSLDRWHRKTLLISGMLGKGQLRALNQSVSAQVTAMLQAPDKLLQCTQLVRSQVPRPLCHGAGMPADPTAQDRMQASGHATGAGAEEDALGDRDPEMFDDSEFYQQLLKEFLESTGAALATSVNVKGPKRRKQVDRRASKGRKLRFHVQDKLINFMTPVPLEHSRFATQLFSNLFSRTGTP